MDTIDKEIELVKELAAKICEKHNLSFIGFFQNSDKSFERVVTEGLDWETPNGSFASSSFGNLSTSSDFQALLSTLLNPIKIATSSPKQTSLQLNNSSSESESISINNSIISTSLAFYDSYKTIVIDPHNKVNVKNYLYNCFEEFQQLPCKLLSKTWIKVIEPKKQSKYPYKQGESSKPYWWPPGCIHREPDHLKKDERINLLINILRIFKHREKELIYTASIINGIGPNNKRSNQNDDFGERKLKMLENMFMMVNAQNNHDIKSLKVIKPGKKYSSQIYLRNKQQKSTNTPKKDSTPKFPSFLTTPPSVDTSKHFKNAKLPLPPQPVANTGESFYNDLMEYMSNKSEENSQQNFLSSTSYNSILSSPFTPSQSLNMKYPIPSIQQRNLPAIANPLLSVNESNIDSHFFANTQPRLGSKLIHNPTSLNTYISPESPFHSMDYHISPPPTGIFIQSKTNCEKQNSNVLSTLNPSKINSMNIRPQNIPIKMKLFENKKKNSPNNLPISDHINILQYGPNNIPTENTHEQDDGDTTDYEMNNDTVKDISQIPKNTS